MSEYNRHKWAMEWMHGGGRDPNGRSLDDEIKIGKEDWMERQRVAQGGRIGLQSGQLVQPGPGRQGYNGKQSNLPTFVYKTKNKENPYQVMKDNKHRGQFKTVEEAEEFIKEKGWTKGKQWSAHKKTAK